MNFRLSLGSAIMCGVMLGAGGCRKGKSEVMVHQGPPPVVAVELETNGLDSLPGAVYRNQADSPIHWQPWTKETMDRAKAANRLVFAVIAMPQQPGFQSVLASLTKDRGMVSLINDNYVPVLI